MRRPDVSGGLGRRHEPRGGCSSVILDCIGMDREQVKGALRARTTPAIYALALVAGKALDIRRGSWVEPELDLIGDLVEPGETVVDVGANYGLWSWHLARAVEPQGRVAAFEPIPATATALRRVLWLLGAGQQVDIHVAGCGEQATRTTFHLPTAGPDGPVIAGLAHMAGADSGNGWKTTTAEMLRLDDVLDGTPVSLIKVDAEGTELFVLRGAEEILARDQPTVICEISESLVRDRYGFEASEVVELMTRHGYSMMRLYAGRLVACDGWHRHVDNYIFVSRRFGDRLSARLAS
jgi:FkbM family methyltransferase